MIYRYQWLQKCVERAKQKSLSILWKTITAISIERNIYAFFQQNASATNYIRKKNQYANVRSNLCVYAVLYWNNYHVIFFCRSTAPCVTLTSFVRFRQMRVFSMNKIVSLEEREKEWPTNNNDGVRQRRNFIVLESLHFIFTSRTMLRNGHWCCSDDSEIADSKWKSFIQLILTGSRNLGWRWEDRGGRTLRLIVKLN